MLPQQCLASADAFTRIFELHFDAQQAVEGWYYRDPRSNSEGHWGASVRGPERAYEVNDEIVEELNPTSRQWENSHKGMQAVVLMYQIIHPRVL